jgi:hypothetical protein
MQTGDTAYLILSDELEEVIREHSGWYPNALLLRKICSLKSENVSRLRCTIHEINDEYGEAEIICDELAADFKNPINVLVSDLEAERDRR